MNNTATIKGDKVLLRPIDDSDTASIIKWRNRENVKRQFVFRETLTEEMHRNWLETRVASGAVVQFIINVKDTNTDVGSVYLRDIIRESGVAEYGIFIGEDDYQGMGYGSEACALSLNYSWDVLELKSVFLRVFKDNYAAINSYEKNGFVPISPEELSAFADVGRIEPGMRFMIVNNPKGQ